jgi:hypothetical protein
MLGEKDKETPAPSVQKLFSEIFCYLMTKFQKGVPASRDAQILSGQFFNGGRDQPATSCPAGIYLLVNSRFAIHVRAPCRWSCYTPRMKLPKATANGHRQEAKVLWRNASTLPKSQRPLVLRQAQCHAYLARALDDPNLDLAEGAPAARSGDGADAG